MDIQFIDITTYRGISSEAEHFYAKVGSPNYTQENYLVMLDCPPESGVMFGESAENLRYMPSYEEAKALYLKDNYNVRDRDLGKLDEDDIMMMVEDGTTRFPSILSIVKRAKDLYPDSILCFSISGYRKEFVKWIQRNKDSEQVHKIIELILGIKC